MPSSGFFRRRTVADLRAEAARSDLKRSLTAFHLVALGVGAIVGAGIFVVIGDAAARLAGPAVAVSFVLVAAASAIVALAYAELATLVPVGGSGYGYATASLGDLPAWLTGWTLVLAYLIGNGAIAASFSANAQSLLVAAGVPLSDAFSAAPPLGVFDLPAALVVLAITFLLARPTSESVGTTVAIVVAKVGILVVFVIAALPSVTATNLTPFAPFGVGGVVAGAAYAFYAFLGFDTVSTTAEEVKDPARALPIGIVGSLLITTLLYVVVALAMTGAVPYPRLAVPDPLAEVMRLTGHPALAVVLNAGGVLATLTVLIAFQFGGARIVLNLARDGFVPARFADVSERTGTPLFTTYVLGVVVALSAALLPLTFLVELTNVGTFVAFSVVLVSVPLLRRIEPAMSRPFRMPLALPLVALGVLMLGGLLVAQTLAAPRALFGYVAFLGLGCIWYALWRAPQRA